MATPEELAKTAEQKKVAEAEKPLPAMVSPTVNLAAEMRMAVSKRCRDTGESFSKVTNEMWLALLKKEKLVVADLAPDFSSKRTGGGMKAKVEAKDAEIARLTAEIAALKAAKK